MDIPGAPSRIVLVEDDPAAARCTRRALSSLRDVVIDICHDVSSAKRAFSRPFDVIVSDFGLPDGTGVDVLREAANLNSAAPGIVLTGNTQWSCAETCINDGGAFRVLGKPVSGEVLTATVRAALTAKRSRDEQAQALADERLGAVPAALHDRERILRALARAIDRRLGVDVARTDVLANIGRGLAERLGLTAAGIAAVELSILAHRIGSAALRDDESAALIPITGAEILRAAGFPEAISHAVGSSSEFAAETAHAPLATRILALATRYLELSTGGLTHRHACAELLRDEALDADLVALFVTEPETAWSIADTRTIPVRPLVPRTHSPEHREEPTHEPSAHVVDRRR